MSKDEPMETYYVSANQGAENLTGDEHIDPQSCVSWSSGESGKSV